MSHWSHLGGHAVQAFTHTLMKDSSASESEESSGRKRVQQVPQDTRRDHFYTVNTQAFESDLNQIMEELRLLVPNICTWGSDTTVEVTIERLMQEVVLHILEPVIDEGEVELPHT